MFDISSSGMHWAEGFKNTESKIWCVNRNAHKDRVKYF